MPMGVEIERKFLVKNNGWQAGHPQGKRYRQGYLCVDRGRTVRVRLEGDEGRLTVKGSARGASRAEYEYAVPRQDAEEMLALCLRPIIEKTRYKIQYGGLTWEVDVFDGDNQGLVVAEVELPSEDHPVELPPWVGEEVTHDPRYANARLVQAPYRTWS